ncbi:RNA-binding domain-containing protein [Chlorobium sp. KB01]|uniref:RNA-binding domain-containing protein n=1 Tax=Chlorobium sp. KB01 TaxID=1917528 RepID=UPI00097755B2|nr:RNA-binding domain-containing protein [Chlorobium sp. KB01]
MDVTKQQILDLIRQGEGISVEFKTCRNKINRDVYDTVCAFLNRHGGTILLGVQDDGTLQGIEPDAVTQIKKDFVTAINNPLKLTPPTYLSIDVAEVDGKSLLRIYVPESSQVHRCNGRIYDRNEDGDLDITDHTTQVAHLYQRKQATFSENRVHPWIQVKDLRPELIEKCRRYARINKDNHSWADMDDLQLLKSAQLYQEDPETKQNGVTLAGVMLFAPDQLILKVCPAHRTDLILRKVNVDRYDDRDLVRTNLIDSYDRILASVQKHLPDPFYLEGIERRSLRDAIFREVASNMLIHREYSSGVPCRFIIEYGQVTTFNANRPHGFGLLNPDTFAPYPKNPVIGAFFREIDRADELGSGMRKMMIYGKKYGGADPQLIEGDVFRMIISVPEFGEKPSHILEVSSRPESGPESIFERVIRELLIGSRSKSELAIALGHTSVSGKLNERVREMLADDLIEYTIPDKPKSRLQKYRLTEKGRKLLENR